MKFICLDDDPRMEPALRRFAKQLGHEVEFHTAGATFKAQIKRQTPDLVLLDLSLGQESGIDIIAWLAQAQIQVPIVLLSGQGDDLLDTARRIATASGILVLGAVSKGQLVRDLPPLLAQRGGSAQPPLIRPAAAPHLTSDELDRYIQAGRIEPYFQPIVSAADRQLRGAEVLARLRLPSGQILGAPAFIPLAEATGLILPLTAALFNRVITLASQLEPLHLEFLAVNLSAATLEQQPTIALVRRLIDGLAGRCQVRVELTETARIADSQPVRELAAQISLLGASLAVDDFGTGYSCIRALTELPFDTLKVDLSFVAEMFDSTKAMKMLLAIIALGHGLGLKVVAEGVETEAQWRVLVESGADLLQGYLFGRPMDILEFVQTRGPARITAGQAA